MSNHGGGRGVLKAGWEWIRRCFSENSGFIWILFLLNYVTLAWSLLAAGDDWHFMEYGSALFLAIFALTLALHAILHERPVTFRRLKGGLLLLSFLPFVVEFFVMYSYGALIGVGIVNSILETNMKEAEEFFAMYVGWREIAGAFLLFGGVFAAWRLRLWARLSIPAVWQNWFLAGGLLLAGGIAFPALPAYADFMLSEMLPIQRICMATGTAVENIAAYHRLADKLNTDVHIVENRSKIQNIVFILGEATNRNHMHLYGYPLPNTPHFDEMAAKGDICVFQDVISPHSTTIAVLSKLFTFCDYESEQPWYEYHNLIDVMNAAGYRTFWLSNQESSGIWGNVAQLYANHSTWHKFTRIRDSREDTGILDECLFPLLEEAREKHSGDRNFYVLHLMGGHGLYYNRYPYAFHKFTDEDIRLPVSKHFKEIVAQYDNALYYNDYIVHHIIETFQDDEAIVIYVPDHGEAVYDEGSVAGHIEENPNRHMIEIPVIVWASKKFKEKYPDKWGAFQRAVNRPYMTDDMIHTILDLADISTEDYQPEKSLINPLFDASRPRIFSNMDYDREIRPKGQTARGDAEDS